MVLCLIKKKRKKRQAPFDYNNENIFVAEQLNVNLRMNDGFLNLILNIFNIQYFNYLCNM